MTGPDQPLVKATGLGVRFGDLTVLDRVDLSVRPGQIVTVIGPNGSGKTTLIRTLLGLVTPSDGTVKRRPGLTIGYVPQSLAVDASLPLTVRRFISLAAPRAGTDEVQAALAEMGVERTSERAVQSLSGGEQKRVLLAQAILRRPDLLVLDEPGAGVDVAGQGELYELIRRIRDRSGLGVLLVSHDLHLVMAAADLVVCLNHHVCCTGHPETVSRDPEYLSLFGAAAGTLALYRHDHDHHHGLDGDPQ